MTLKFDWKGGSANFFAFRMYDSTLIGEIKNWSYSALFFSVLRHRMLLMDVILVSQWIARENLNPKHKWKSKFRLLDLIQASKYYQTFFRSPCRITHQLPPSLVVQAIYPKFLWSCLLLTWVILTNASLTPSPVPGRPRFSRKSWKKIKSNMYAFKIVLSFNSLMFVVRCKIYVCHI